LTKHYIPEPAEHQNYTYKHCRFVAGKDRSNLVDPSSIIAETLALISLLTQRTGHHLSKNNGAQDCSSLVPLIFLRFSSLLLCTKSLATRGRRLNDTTAQRQDIVYVIDVLVQVGVQGGARVQSRIIAPFEMHECDRGGVEPRNNRQGICQGARIGK